jgi:tRNA U34 2-thiouridine synthase MnmA/TrmU
VLFPLGDYYNSQTSMINDVENANVHDKPNTQMTVQELGAQQEAILPNASKRDSIRICFIGKRKHGKFLNEYIAPASRTTSNAKMGAHPAAPVMGMRQN